MRVVAVFLVAVAIGCSVQRRGPVPSKTPGASTGEESPTKPEPVRAPHAISCRGDFDCPRDGLGRETSCTKGECVDSPLVKCRAATHVGVVAGEQAGDACIPKPLCAWECARQVTSLWRGLSTAPLCGTAWGNCTDSAMRTTQEASITWGFCLRECWEEPPPDRGQCKYEEQGTCRLPSGAEGLCRPTIGIEPSSAFCFSKQEFSKRCLDYSLAWHARVAPETIVEYSRCRETSCGESDRRLSRGAVARHRERYTSNHLPCIWALYHHLREQEASHEQ